MNDNPNVSELEELRMTVKLLKQSLENATDESRYDWHSDSFAQDRYNQGQIAMAEQILFAYRGRLNAIK